MLPVAIVTGAGQGIGRAIALRLAREHYAVALVDLDAQGLAETVEALTRQDVPVLAVHTDLVDLQNVARAIDRVLSSWQRVDVLVNNAGRELTKPFLEVSESDWDAILSINLKTVFFATQVVARAMISGGIQGRIVNIASVAGRSGRADQAPYAIAKAGVLSVTRSAARALAPHHITVNAVCPGVVDTAMTRRIHALRAQRAGISVEESIARMISAIPLGRMASPEDVAGAVAFLCSQQASYLTGQALNVCGGMEMQ